MGKPDKQIILGQKKEIEEMPMQFDSQRDIKPHPSIRKNLSTGNTPLKKIPFPKVDPNGVASNFQELLASERYREVLEKVKHYTGYRNVPETSIPVLMTQMMQAFQTVVLTERRYKTQLEQLALELVKREMGISEGDLNFDAKIVGMGEINADFNRNVRDTDNVRPDVDRSDDGQDSDGDQEQEDNDGNDTDGDGTDTEDNPDVPNVEDEDAKLEGQLYKRLTNLDLERAKRRFINAIVQGASKRGHYMYHLVSERLRQITGSDQLLNAYGIMMSVNDLLYWMMPDTYVDRMGVGRGGVEGGQGDSEVQWGTRNPNVGAVGGNPDDMTSRTGTLRPTGDDEDYDNTEHFGDQMADVQQAMNTPAGSSEIDRNTEIPTIKARGFCFPVLLHELVKSVMEVLAAHGLPKNNKLAAEVIDLEDVLQKEFWDMRLGPAIWNRLRQQIPEDVLTDDDKKELQNFLFAEFFKLPAKEFLVFSREVISGSNKGARLMKELTDEVVQRINNKDDEDYDYGQSNFRRDLNTLSKDVDDEDLDDMLKNLGITRSDDDE